MVRNSAANLALHVVSPTTSHHQENDAERSVNNLLSLPGEIKNKIYRLCAVDIPDPLIPPAKDDNTKFALLYTCRTIYSEANYLYYSDTTLAFIDLYHLYRFLGSRSSFSRNSIRSVRFQYHNSAWAYDALELLSTCHGLRHLHIHAANHMDLDSPGVWSLQKLRKIRRLEFSGWKYDISSMCKTTLRKVMKRKRGPLVSKAWTQEDGKHRQKYSEKLKIDQRRTRMASLRSQGRH